MTPDHSALIERLDLIVAELEGLPHVKQTVAEAAVALRDLTEWRDIADHDNSATEVLVMAEGWSKPIVAWRHHPSSRTDKWLSVPGAYRVKPSRFCPLPSAPNQAKEAGE